MVNFEEGSHVHTLVLLLSVAGELPYNSLRLIGSERVLRALVHKLTTIQTFRSRLREERLTCKLLTLTGKGIHKSIRLHKSGLSILTWIHPDAYGFYLSSFWNHHFPGDLSHRDRNHRVGEAIILMHRSQFEIRPYCLEELQSREILPARLKPNSYYLAKSMKGSGTEELNKTMFTRFVGGLFTSDCFYVLYNTRRAVMKWSGMGEFKTLHHLSEIVRMNSELEHVTDAILIGQSGEVALNTLLESERTRRLEFRFDGIYPHIYFIPATAEGIGQLKMLAVPDWKEKILELLFDHVERVYNQGLFECDARLGEKYILSHLDGDIARLTRFKDAVSYHAELKFEVICFPQQVHYTEAYLGKRVDIKVIEQDLILQALNLNERKEE